MLTNQDEEWLSRKHPELKVNAKQISGEVGFTATYNEQSRRFLEIEEATHDGVGGLRLAGRFKIRIEERSDMSHSRLPALFVENVLHVADRHFNQTDLSGCLCNPLEEDEVLLPRFEFKRYLGELVIPFLYGQLFYDKKGRWPWHEYAHGGVGLLEAYFLKRNPVKAEECLRRMYRELRLWQRLKPLLLQNGRIKGHTSCLCPKRDHMRRCHPDALEGIRCLKHDIEHQKISLP
jgi:hypothetical protein